jgi:hypothetical protein
MSSRGEQRSRAVTSKERAHATSWGVFASVLLVIAGALNVLNGYTLIEHHSYFRTHIPLSGGLTGWGWVFVIWGALQLAAGLLAWRGRLIGNVIGVCVCGIAAMIWFLLVFAAPWAAMIGIGINVAIIFALTAGGWPDNATEDWRFESDRG